MKPTTNLQNETNDDDDKNKKEDVKKCDTEVSADDVAQKNDNDEDDKIPLCELRQRLAGNAGKSAKGKPPTPKTPVSQTSKRESNSGKVEVSDSGTKKSRKKSQFPTTTEDGAKVKAISKDVVDDGKRKQKGKTKETKRASTEKKVVGRARAPQTVDDNKKTGDDDATSEEDAPACCLCHCGLDCSDRALFFVEDREKEWKDEEEYDFQLDDPYLPKVLYDPHNALVYCDACDRLYHQKCHFIPLLVVPRGDWHCMICQLQKQKSQRSKQPKEEQKWKKFCQKPIANQIFKNVPSLTAETQALQQEFEHSTHAIKAQLWQKQFQQLRSFLKTQAANIRMATAALTTLTSTKRNRAYLGRHSQELAQTLARLSMGKWKIRSALLNLEQVRKQANTLPGRTLMEFVRQHPQHNSYIFPHGIELYEKHRRVIPRTPEMKVEDEEMPMEMVMPKWKAKNGNSVPTEIVVSQSPLTPTKPTKALSKSSAMSPTSPASPSPRTKRKLLKIQVNNGNKKQPPLIPLPTPAAEKEREREQKKDIDDEDSGISLDDLKCCVCFVEDATDENDVMLCDGEGCYRAFHMKCVWPQITKIEEEEDWFCPLCEAISNLIADTQIACMGEDWEHRRETDDHRIIMETSSLQSWANAHDVFPEAEWEYSTSVQLKAGKQNEDTTNLLALYLGEEMVVQEANVMPVGSDSEDENDYSLFDEASYEAKRRREWEAIDGKTDDKKGADEDDEDEENDSDAASNHDDSTRSSQATLVEMSSVELNIDKSELAALSDGGASSEEDSPLSGASEASGRNHRTRRSRRLKNRRSSVSAAATSERSTLVDHNGADFDEANIIEGKRRRKAVDYRKLNDSLFGGLSAAERAKLDDKTDYRETKRKRKNGNGKANPRGKKKPRTVESDNEGEIDKSDAQSDLVV